MSLAPGCWLGPYEVIGLLGAGGMGEVYRARDPRIEREVAIKVLPAAVAKDAVPLRRFEQELKAAGAINHPNILSIYDVGSRDGAPFIVSELLEGETLRRRLGGGPLPLSAALEYAVGIARGLAAAHEKRIVHRDLKPENIFITKDGRVKILDFGLAKAEQAAASECGPAVSTLELNTQPGLVMGTVGYMSPEQIRGWEVGPASDIFALGSVMYEMIGGRRPFMGANTAETLTRILRDDPIPLPELAPHTPAELSRLIAHCLEKNPEARRQSARDLASDLKAMLDGGVPAQAAAAGKTAHSVAVLPFVSASPDPDTEVLCDGITETIINSLAQLSQLRVTPRSAVYRYKGRDSDPQSVGRELNVRVVLTGRVMQRGEALVVAAELIDVAEGALVWGERYNRKIIDIFSLEEEIASQISEKLRMKLTGAEKQRLAKRFTEDPEAYQLYLKGRHYWLRWTPDSMRKGVACFQQAIEKDPGYALAYAGMADCLSYMSLYLAMPEKEGWAKAKAAAAAAIGLDAELAEGYTSMAFIRGYPDRDLPAAEKLFQRAIELNPNSWLTHFWYGNVLSIFSRHDAAEEQFRLALELEPLSPVVLQGAAFNSILSRRFAEAEQRCLNGLEVYPDYANFRLMLGLAYEYQGRFEEAIREFGKSRLSMGPAPIVIASEAHAQALAGNLEEARRLAAELKANAVPGVMDVCQAIVHVGLGEYDAALERLEAACVIVSTGLTWLAMDPRLDPIRDNTAFRSVLRRMGPEYTRAGSGSGSGSAG